MKSTKSALAILGFFAAAAFAGSAAAQENRGVYLGGASGVAQYTDACQNLGVACDDRDAAWRFFGGYRFNQTFSAELGYADLGVVTGDGGVATARAETKAWDLVGLVSVPVVGGLSILGKLGAYRARVSTDVAGSTNTAFTYGAGLGYELGRIGLRAEWQRYDSVGGGTTGRDDIQVVSVSALFRF